MISEEIKKIEAGLYFLKLQEIDKEITLEKEINKDSDQEFENITNKMNVNDTLPIIISKYDHLPSKSFSDLFYYTRTYAINTMKHGANLK